MKYIRSYESKEIKFRVGDYVKFLDNYWAKNKRMGFYRITTINSPNSKSINKDISLRPISNQSKELIYMAGDLINIKKDDLILVPDYELKANKYNI